MRLSLGVLAAALGLALSIGPAVVGHAFPGASALGPLGAVVLGGLIAMRACRRRS
jgi:MYXO-CTERM domain-containing protein